MPKCRNNTTRQSSLSPGLRRPDQPLAAGRLGDLETERENPNPTLVYVVSSILLQMGQTVCWIPLNLPSQILGKIRSRKGKEKNKDNVMTVLVSFFFFPSMTQDQVICEEELQL